MQYTAFDRCKLLKQKGLKSERFSDYCKQVSNESFLWLDQYCLKFRYISDIIDTWMHIVIYLSSEVKPLIFCEHKALLGSDRHALMKILS